MKKIRFKDKKHGALVLSGGGVKAAAFHIGVCLALKEKGFHFEGGLKNENKDYKTPENAKTFQTYVGSSAGSIVAATLASGYSVDDLIHAYEMGIIKGAPKKETSLKPLGYWDLFSLNGPSMLKSVPNFLRMKSLVTGGFEAFMKNGMKLNGLFTAKGIEKYFRKSVLPTNNFSALRSNLYIVATQLNHSRKVVFGPFEENTYRDDVKMMNFSNISEAIAASTSLPPVFAPYGIQNEKGDMIYYFDGEIRDTLSTHVASDHGADLVVSSYSVQPYHYNKKMGSLHKYGIPVILNQALYQVVEQKIKKHIQHRQDILSTLSSIEGYFKQANLPEEHAKKLIEIIEQKINFKSGVEYIYIHPNPQDYEMFFVDHFSLNREILQRIVKIGFKSALRVLRNYDL